MAAPKLTEEQRNFKKDDTLICRISYEPSEPPADDEIELIIGEKVKFDKYLYDSQDYSIVWKEGTLKQGAYPTAGLEKDPASTIGSSSLATSETIYPIVVEIPMEGGSLSWKEGVEENKIENTSSAGDKNSLLTKWDRYLGSLLNFQKEQNKRDLETSDIYKFAYIPTIDTLALMKSDSTIPLEKYWKSLASTSYKEKRENYIHRRHKDKFVMNLVVWSKMKLTMDLLFNSVYDYKTFAEAWGDLKFENIPPESDELYTAQPNTSQLDKLYKDLIAYKNSEEEDIGVKRMIGILSKGNDTMTNFEWKDLILFANSMSSFIHRGNLNGLIQIFAILNLFVLRFFVIEYMKYWGQKKTFTDKIVAREEAFLKSMEFLLEKLFPSRGDASVGGGGAPPHLKGYFDDILKHIYKNFWTGGKIKPTVHVCLIKLASFVILFDFYDVEGEILNVLCVPNLLGKNIYIKFREPDIVSSGDANSGQDTLILHSPPELKYYLNWKGYISGEYSYMRTYTSFNEIRIPGEEAAVAAIRPDYFNRVRLLNKLLIGEPSVSPIPDITDRPDGGNWPSKVFVARMDGITKDEQNSLAININSSFVDTIVTPPSTDKLYTMYDYIVEGEKFKIRSFTAVLKIEGGKITSFENSGGSAVVAEGTIDSIDTLFEELGDKQIGKLMKFKFEDEIASSMRDDKHNKENSYILGYTDNEEYEDEIKKGLDWVPAGGFKQRGGKKEEVAQSIRTWADNLVAKIQTMKPPAPPAPSESIQSNPSENTLESNISNLENTIKKRVSVTPQLETILNKEEEILKINARGGTKKRKRRRNVLKTTMKK